MECSCREGVEGYVMDCIFSAFSVLDVQCEKPFITDVLYCICDDVVCGVVFPFKGCAVCFCFCVCHIVCVVYCGW